MPAPNLLQRRAPALALVAIVFAITYWGSGLVAWRPTSVLTPTEFDRRIPLVAWAIWGYLSVIVLVTIALIVPRGAIRARTAVAMALGCVIAAVLFVAWPTAIARPVAPAGDMAHVGWALLYSIDTERNVLPSLHATFAIVAAAALWRSGASWRVVGCAWAFGVLLAALLVKQHYLTDLLAGVGLGTLAWLFAGAVEGARRRAHAG
jgi:membrane-associated phospholipid phosphatase